MDEYSAYKLLVEGTDVTKKSEKKDVKKSKTFIKEEKIKKLRLENKIKCHSKFCNVPDPVKSFEQLITRFNLSKDFLKCFASLEYKSPTPVQMQSIPVMLEKHNLFTLAPTGSGKTAAFLVPLLHEIMNKPVDTHTGNPVCHPTAVILSPTVELAKQTYQECVCLIKELELAIKPNVAIFFKGKKLNVKADIIICTPLRLKETLANKKEELSLTKLSWLVIDESDKMFEESINSFSEQFRFIYEKCTESGDFRVAMFSATQTKPITDWVKENLTADLVYVRIGVKGAAVETVSQELRYCFSEEIKLAEIKSLISAGKLQVPCLIFLDQCVNAGYLHEFIREYGLKANIVVGVISGKLNDSARRDVISDFREGKIHFLICTNLLARGIDFKGVATVVNYDLPKHKEEYIHRIGRCGRAGQPGKSISFWTDEDALNGLPDVLAIMKASNQPVNEELFQLVKQRLKNRHYKGDRILKKLKRKYKSDDDKTKPMNRNDKRRKLFVENCVVRKKFLERKKLNCADDENKE